MCIVIINYSTIVNQFPSFYIEKVLVFMMIQENNPQNQIEVHDYKFDLSNELDTLQKQRRHILTGSSFTFGF